MTKNQYKAITSLIWMAYSFLGAGLLDVRWAQWALVACGFLFLFAYLRANRAVDHE